MMGWTDNVAAIRRALEWSFDPSNTECEHRTEGQTCGACEGCESRRCGEALADLDGLVDAMKAQESALGQNVFQPNAAIAPLTKFGAQLIAHDPRLDALPVLAFSHVGFHAKAMTDWAMRCNRWSFTDETTDQAARLYALATALPGVPAGQLLEVVQGIRTIDGDAESVVISDPLEET